MKKKQNHLSRLQWHIYMVAFALVIVAFLGVFLTYSWYHIGDETGNMGFEVLQIDSVVTMYEAVDHNKNGVPDLLKTNDQEENTYQYLSEENGDIAYVAYDLPYYSEIYDFAYSDTTLVLDQDSSANMFSVLTLKELYPSRMYTIKYALANYHFGSNVIRFAFDERASVDQEDTARIMSPKGDLSQFRMRLAKVNQDGSLTFGEWKKFDFDNAGRLLSLPMTIGEENLLLAPYTGDAGSGRLDVWLQIQLLPEAGNALQNKEIVFPDFRITFEAFDRSE